MEENVKELLFKQAIVSVKIKDPTPTRNFVWYPNKWFLGIFLEKKEGFYEWYSSTPTTEEEILKIGYYIIKDKLVYLKPRLIINRVDGKSSEHFFDSLEEIHKFISQEGLDKLDHIKLDKLDHIKIY